MLDCFFKCTCEIPWFGYVEKISGKSLRATYELHIIPRTPDCGNCVPYDFRGLFARDCFSRGVFLWRLGLLFQEPFFRETCRGLTIKRFFRVTCFRGFFSGGFSVDVSGDFPNSKTFESIFKPHYAVNKMWRLFVHNCSNVNDTKNDSPIIHEFIFHYGRFRFMKYCILLRTYLCAIIVQFQNQTKLCSNCVSIDPRRMRLSWLTFQQLWPKLGTNAIHRLEQVVYWSSIAISDCALKLVQSGAILD